MLVEIDGVERWDPALRVAVMFCGQIRLLEELVASQSGLLGPEADMIYIDSAAFRRFLRAVLDYLELSHSRALLTMVSGVLQVGLALDAKAHGGDWLPVPESFSGIATAARSVLSRPLSD